MVQHVRPTEGRHTSPKAILREYFGDRQWDGGSLEECVLDGMKIAAATKKQFLWLTCTNKGSSEVCEAALRVQGITEEQLKAGYPCDPTSKSKLRVIAKPGVLIRLTRNLDKSRGFVNVAIADEQALPRLQK